VDLPQRGASCKIAPKPEPPAAAANECRDRVETKVVGDATMGFPVKSVVTTITGEGDKDRHETTSASEVTSLEITRLHRALCDIPALSARATSSAELMRPPATGTSLEEALFGSTADGTGKAAPKQAGVIRFGVLEPIDKSGRALNARLLRQELAGKFSSRPYQALPLSGSSATAIEADAKRLECDYVLLTEISEVKTSKPGKVGGLLKAASGGPANATN